MSKISFQNEESLNDYINQCIFLQRINKEDYCFSLEVASILLAEGISIPPISFISDVSNLLLSKYNTELVDEQELFKDKIFVNYDDYVIGRLIYNQNIKRISKCLSQYKNEDKAKGVAYIIKRIIENTKPLCVDVPLSKIKTLLKLKKDLSKNKFYLENISELILNQYISLVEQFKKCFNIIEEEDCISLEHKTALMELNQYVAHRQIIKQILLLDKEIPKYPMLPYSSRKEIKTKITEEDMYPIGGYVSISNKGTVESLLQSELAFIENQEPIDLFDLKHLQNELFYYSRDDNNLMRNKRAFIFVLDEDLIEIRFKDKDKPVQRIVLFISMIIEIIKKIISWIDSPSTQFKIILKEKSDFSKNEIEIMKIILKEYVENEVVEFVYDIQDKDIENYYNENIDANLTRFIFFNSNKKNINFKQIFFNQVVLKESIPYIIDENNNIVDIKNNYNSFFWSDMTKTILSMII